MKNQIFPCLWFDNDAIDAAEFYCGIFENSKIISNTPVVVMFELNGEKIMGLNGGPMHKINPSISMFVHCDNIEESKRLWNKLSDGASILMALDKYPWSEQYGWLQDKFGFTWQIMKGTSNKMMPSLLFTGDQFGRTEEALNYYTGVFANSAIIKKDHYQNDTPFAGNIAYAEFKLSQYPMVAMDGPGDHKFAFSEAVSLVVPCDSQTEVDYYWNEFTSDGGTESRCGWCKDKFGVSWQIVPSNMGHLLGNAENGQRAMQAMLKMNKIEIDKLVNA